MYIIAILCVCLYAGSQQHFVKSTDWIDDVTRYVVEDSKFYEVKIMTRLDDNEIIKNPLFDELVFNIMQNVPVVRINFGENFELPVNSVPNESHETMTPIGTSATLFLLVVESRESVPILMMKNFIDTVAKMATYHYSPKYLMVSFVRKSSEHVEELLQHAWTKKMLDFSVIELVEPDVPRRSILIERSVALPTIHQLNPFKNQYTRNNWTGDMNNLVPNKVTNLWGHVLMTNVCLASGVHGKSSEVCELLDIFIQKVNGTGNHSPPVELDILDDGRGIYWDVEVRDLDFTAALYPDFAIRGWNDTQRTTTVLNDELCAVVPVLSRSEFRAPTNLFTAYLLSFSIVLIFWIFMRLLGSKSRFSRMFYIARVLFGISVTSTPRGNVDRIIFACLLAISAMYSSTIYASITDFIFEKNGEIEFASLDELGNSELHPFISEHNFAKASDLFNGPLKNLVNKSITDTLPYPCVVSLFSNKNRMCFARKTIVNEVRLLFGKGLKHSVMKLVKPCLWNENLSFIVGKRSPYRSTLDKLIMRVQSAGFLTRNFMGDDPYSARMIESLRVRKQLKERAVLRQQLIALSIVGYSLSIVVFIAEIIFHHASKYYKKKKIKHPLPPLLPYTE